MSAKAIDVIYLYEHAARELDVACAIKHIAGKQYGLKIEIFQWPYEEYEALTQYKPRVVVLPFCYQERSHYDCLLEWINSVYFNLSWEELFYTGNRKAKSPRGDFACRHVIHHAWGNFYADFLITHGVPRNHIFINGNPAYKLYDKPYRNFFDTRQNLSQRHNIDPSKKWILFPENYNWAFYTEASLRQIIADGQSPEEINILRQFCSLSLTEVIKWCRDVAKHETVELIIRPRPATLIEDFRKAIKSIISDIPEKMHIIQDGSVREWILNSDLVISSHSTSLIEAAVSGKKVFMVEPFQIPTSLNMDWHELLYHVRTRSEFMNACIDGSHLDNDTRLSDWARHQMMANGDAIWNLASFLGRLCREEVPLPPVPHKNTITTKESSHTPVCLKYEYLKIRRRIGRIVKPQRPIPLEYKKDVLSREEMAHRVNQWGRVLEDYLPVSQ